MTDRAADALEVGQALLALGREERERIREGRVEALEEIAGRRADLLRRFTAALPAGEPVPEDVRAVLDEVRREGAENIVILRSLQQDISAQLETDSRTVLAARSYGGVSRY